MIGVVVALLVIFLLWFSQTPTGQSTELQKTELIPQFISPLKEGFIKKAIIELSQVLLGD